MHENVNRLLIVDGSREVAATIEKTARAMGFAVASTTEATEFLRLVDDFRPSAIAMDVELLQTNGSELLRHLAARDCKSGIVLTGEGERRVLSAIRNAGAGHGLAMASTLRNPFERAELEAALAGVLRQDSQLRVADLRRALSSGELIAYFQPKVTLTGTGEWRIDALEALVRWQHPTLGLVMPDEFIPMAERTGLVAALTEEVLSQTLTQLKSWNERGLELGCAVNLAPSLVTDLEFPDRVTRMVAEHGLEPSRLSLELTETATMHDPAASMDILTRLRARGIGLSLDDFGTGFSSLTRLYQMPFDEMKIDKSLVMNVPGSREANTMVGSLIELGHNLGMKVCAEGVESREALDLLAALRCDRCQGYFIGRALPPNDIPSFVKRWNEAGPASTDHQTARSAI